MNLIAQNRIIYSQYENSTYKLILILYKSTTRPINKINKRIHMNLRIITGFILILILTILCINYNTNYESNLEYPSTGAILAEYPEGSTVYVSGEVTGLNSDGFELQNDYNGKKVGYIIETSKKAEIGDNVQVVGILGPSLTLKSTEIIVMEKWSYEFVLIRSAFALILLIFIFFSYWKFDFKIFQFVRRK